MLRFISFVCLLLISMPSCAGGDKPKTGTFFDVADNNGAWRGGAKYHEHLVFYISPGHRSKSLSYKNTKRKSWQSVLKQASWDNSSNIAVLAAPTGSLSSFDKENRFPISKIALEFKEGGLACKPLSTRKLLIDDEMMVYLERMYQKQTMGLDRGIGVPDVGEYAVMNTYKPECFTGKAKKQIKIYAGFLEPAKSTVSKRLAKEIAKEFNISKK